VPALPVALDGERLAKRADPPRVGEHARELLAGLGCSPQEIESLRDRGIVALPQPSSTTEEP
jgi:crotonobetainyl-CoA:carnitine CoA-transferase CaiB-like acyl-CoA transferase